MGCGWLDMGGEFGGLRVIHELGSFSLSVDDPPPRPTGWPRTRAAAHPLQGPRRRSSRAGPLTGLTLGQLRSWSGQRPNWKATKA